MKFAAMPVFLLLLAAGLARGQGISGSISGGPGLVVVPGQAPSGVISGSVVDDRGAAVMRVVVHALAPPTKTFDGRIVEMTRSAPTDEGGRFRIDHLPAGSYLVAVAPPISIRIVRPGMAAAATGDQPVYALTYFPGTIDRAQAQPVTVSGSEEQTIFIELPRVAPVHVRGTVSSPSGRSTSGVMIMLGRMIGSSGGTSMAGYVQADGSFDIPIPPGTYTLIANTAPGSTGGEFAAVDIRASDGDVNDVALVLGSGGTVRGQIVFDSASPGGAPLGATMTLGPAPGGSMIGRPFATVPVAEDWTFETTGLYGSYRFSAPGTLAMQYRVTKVEFDGREVGNNAVAA